MKKTRERKRGRNHCYMTNVREKRQKERAVMIILPTMCRENYPSFVLFLAALPFSTKRNSQKYTLHKCLYLSQFITTMELHHSLCQEV